MKRASGLSRILLIAAACLVCVIHSPAHATAIGDLAASMQPGTFAAVSGMNGWNSGGVLSPTDVSGCTSGDYITEYADKAPWDPINQRLLFVGQVHGQCYAGKFVIYTDATSSWSQGSYPPGVCQSGTSSSPCFAHAYDHNTVDPTTGDFYYRQSYSMKFFRYTNGAWTSLPTPPTQSSVCCGALEYFPDLHRLLFLDGDWGLWAYDPKANTWTQLANANVANATAGLLNLPMAEGTVFALYNPVVKAVLFGGGSAGLYKIDASGKITHLNSPPVILGVTNAVAAVDPVGGKYLVLAGASMYQYDMTADAWNVVSIGVPSVLSGLGGFGDGLVATSVTTYGVIMYTKYDLGSSQVYLYKHSPTPPLSGVPPPLKPNPPTSVNAK